MSPRQNEQWTTGNEKEHIKTLIDGTCFPANTCSHVWPGAKHMLRGYLAGAHLRTVWGGINREKVIKFAEEQLSRFLDS